MEKDIYIQISYECSELEKDILVQSAPLSAPEVEKLWLSPS